MATRYGSGLNDESCIDAWGFIPIDMRLMLFGARSRGHYDVQLPYRFLSGML